MFYTELANKAEEAFRAKREKQKQKKDAHFKQQEEEFLKSKQRNLISFLKNLEVELPEYFSGTAIQLTPQITLEGVTSGEKNAEVFSLCPHCNARFKIKEVDNYHFLAELGEAIVEWQLPEFHRTGNCVEEPKEKEIEVEELFLSPAERELISAIRKLVN